MARPATVNTVDGELEIAGLGTTLMHEHILLVEPELDRNYPGWFDEELEVADAHRQLVELKAAGVDTIVDMTVLGLGRNIDLVRRVVAGTGLNVIVATGLYTADELPLFFRRRGPGTLFGGPDPLEEFFVKDIVDGIAGTGVRAGVIKCATGERGLTPDVERILRSAAAAHHRTGVPISTHTDPATRRGLDQQRVLTSEGVDLRHVLIGHCGETEDLDYLTELMEAGSFIGMDRFGMDNIMPTAERCRIVAKLVRRGFASRMILSQDTSCYTVNWDKEARARMIPDWNLAFITTRVLDMLRELGVGEQEIDQMMRTNAAEILAPLPAGA